VVIVLTIGSKVRVFKPGRERWIFKGDKKNSTTFFGGEVKPSATCRNILRHDKDPSRYDRDTDMQIQRLFLSQILPASLLGVPAVTRKLW
jgi:hypothetical protein